MTVTVEAAVNGYFVVDDGVRIWAADREEIFEERYATEHEATGLGDAIVEVIAEAHGCVVRQASPGWTSTGSAVPRQVVGGRLSRRIRSMAEAGVGLASKPWIISSENL